MKGERGAGEKAEGLKAQSLTPGPGRGCTCPGTPPCSRSPRDTRKLSQCFSSVSSLPVHTRLLCSSFTQKYCCIYTSGGLKGPPTPHPFSSSLKTFWGKQTNKQTKKNVCHFADSQKRKPTVRWSQSGLFPLDGAASFVCVVEPLKKACPGDL